MKRILFGLLLVFLFVSVLTLQFNIRPVETSEIGGNQEENNSVAWGSRERNYSVNRDARIIKHRMTFSELEELKREVGVWKKDEMYNVIINGYGTGLRPPTEEEWLRIRTEAYVVDEITCDEKIKSLSSVDHSVGSWFPPIGNQDGEGSCVAWAVGYYMKTFQEAIERGWNLTQAEWEGGYTGHPTGAYQNRIISPDFIYHQINRGVDEGSYFSDAMNLVCSIGACSWEKMPYDPSDHSSWPSEDAWMEAPLYRGNSTGYEYLNLDTDVDILYLKNWVASNHLAVLNIDASQYSNLTSDDVWTLDNYVGGGGHANVIVGYDDNLEYMEEGETRFGAFRIANSWGVGGWENIDDGCYWISYEAMKQREGYCMFYRDVIGYDPETIAVFRIDHGKRGECEITVGIGNRSSPIQTKRFDNWIWDGGDHPFCPNNIILDITEFEEAVPSVIDQAFFIKVRDGGSHTEGTIQNFSISYYQNYTGGLINITATSYDVPVSTINNIDVYADLILGTSPVVHYSGLPKIDNIYYKTYPNATLDFIVDEFLACETDWIDGPSRSDLYQSVIDAGHTVSEMSPAVKFTFFPINNRDTKYSSGEPNAPLNDSNWRLALSYVYGMDDKQADVSGYYGVPWQQALGNPVPPAQEPWYDAATTMPNTDNATAWTILSDANYSIADYGGQQWLHRNGVPVRPPDGPNDGKITLLYTTGEEVYPNGPLGGMATNWNAFITDYKGAEGPTMEVSPTDFTTLVVDLLAVRDYDVIGIGWPTDLGRYVDWIYDCFHSSTDVPWGWNFCGVHDDDFDRWGKIILTSINTEKVIEATENFTRKFIYELVPWFPAIYGYEFCTTKVIGETELTNLVPMRIYGPSNDYSRMCAHWKGTPDIVWPGGSYTVALGDEPGTLNPWTEDVYYGWEILDQAILNDKTGLLGIDPSTLKNMPMIATKWTLQNWTSMPELGIENGSTVTFYLRQDVLWHDLEEVTAYDCVANMRFMRQYHPGRYSGTWEHLVYEEADGPYKVNVFFDQTSLYHAHFVAGTALLVPEHIIDEVESYWQTWDPTQEDYVDLGLGSAPTEYPFLTQLVGCGPFVFDYYDRALAVGHVTRFEEFFVNAPVIGSVMGEWRIDPGTSYTYEPLIHNWGAKVADDRGTLTSTSVDVAIYEDGILAHVVNDTILDPWEWIYLGPYTKTNVTCGYHNITIIVTGSIFNHTYVHQFVATMREDINTYTGEMLYCIVEMSDVSRAARAFGSMPGNFRWDPPADINDDFLVDLRDISSVARKFGWHC